MRPAASVVLMPSSNEMNSMLRVRNSLSAVYEVLCRKGEPIELPNGHDVEFTRLRVAHKPVRRRPLGHSGRSSARSAPIRLSYQRSLGFQLEVPRLGGRVRAERKISEK